MRRLTIEGDWIREGVGADECWVIRDMGERQAFVFVNHPSIRVTVEHLADPLPTDKGQRFWGKTDATVPQWWFVRFSLHHPNYGVRYTPMVDEDVAYEMSADEAREAGLVQLPEPEEQL